MHAVGKDREHATGTIWRNIATGVQPAICDRSVQTTRPIRLLGREILGYELVLADGYGPDDRAVSDNGTSARQERGLEMALPEKHGSLLPFGHGNCPPQLRYRTEFGGRRAWGP